jgi:hypothetical protein
MGYRADKVKAGLFGFMQGSGMTACGAGILGASVSILGFDNPAVFPILPTAITALGGVATYAVGKALDDDCEPSASANGKIAGMLTAAFVAVGLATHMTSRPAPHKPQPTPPEGALIEKFAGACNGEAKIVRTGADIRLVLPQGCALSP